MKLVVAILKPFKLEDVMEALKNLGVAGVTLTEAQGFGQQLPVEKRGHFLALELGARDGHPRPVVLLGRATDEEHLVADDLQTDR